MLGSISVPEPSSLQTVSLLPTSLARSRMQSKPECPPRPSSLRDFDRFHPCDPAPPTEAAARQGGFPLRFVAPGRAEKHFAATLRRSCKSHRDVLPQSGQCRSAGGRRPRAPRTACILFFNFQEHGRIRGLVAEMHLLRTGASYWRIVLAPCPPESDGCGRGRQ